MKLDILKLSIPAALLCFAGTAFATSDGNSAAAQAHTSAMTAKSQANDKLGDMVKQKLNSDKRLQSAKIETAITSQGAVLLRGTVRNKQQSQLAEQLAATVSGVNKVQNELKVPRGE